MSKRLLDLARCRTETIKVAGETFVVYEPSALQLIEHRQRKLEPEETDEQGKPKPRRLREDATERGLAYLIANCVRDEHGHPAWTEDEAFVIATGRAEVAMPIITAVTEFMGREKKASDPPSDSGTASP